MPVFWTFLIFLPFLKIIFEKTLDFFRLRTHNNRALSCDHIDKRL